MSWVDNPANDPYKMPWRGYPSRREPLPLRVRFDSKVIKPLDPHACWGWRGAHFKQNGYCCFSIKCPDGKWRPTTAHRVAYELYAGEIPDGYWVDHDCRNHGCVNPAHLEAVPPRVNTARGQAPSAIAVRLNRCSRGHEFTEANTIWKRGGKKRDCRICTRARDRERNRTEARRAHYRAAYARRKAARQEVMHEAA
jgi:hypothetical protein